MNVFHCSCDFHCCSNGCCKARDRSHVDHREFLLIALVDALKTRRTICEQAQQLRQLVSQNSKKRAVADLSQRVQEGLALISLQRGGGAEDGSLLTVDPLSASVPRLGSPPHQMFPIGNICLRRPPPSRLSGLQEGPPHAF